MRGPMRRADFHYELPPELIAQAPLPERSASRLLCLDDAGITPDVFEELPRVGDPRIAYMMLRMRQSHDLWHVLTGYSPDVPGEIRLQAFTFAQTNAPSALVLTVFGTVRWTIAMKGHVGEVMCAYWCGKATKWFPTFRWEDHWETPLDELRAMLTCPA